MEKAEKQLRELQMALCKPKAGGKIEATYRLEEMHVEEKSIIKALEIDDIHNNRLKFNGVGVYN
ncbi:MAG: hypothetical protein K8F52_00225 [Candidatus Scalindua rubra]|uniref:Uncharacterized protein n=1 Tax=Candidatus Scalindua brodae TaxID=237368 RepID=A0A0B0ESS8_9BACT|nr:MAG: hypothetical protein SCABRO_00468 [Candidatus Scalindua brodae]MBZ0107064.1 hypothetical protein [Candidatus Scalindua rubra]